MDLIHLKLKRFVVANYKSVRRIELDQLDNMVWLAGRNNAGKSNLLDAFQFLADATVSFEHALASRGQDITQVILGKNPRAKMEFVFDFSLMIEKRSELIEQLFAGCPPAVMADVLASDFLSSVSLKISIGRDSYTEELTTANLRGDKPCLIFSIKGAPKKIEVVCGQMEVFCKKCQDGKVELPSEPFVPDLPLEQHHPYRLRLGRPESGVAFPISDEVADGVRQQFTTMEWVAPMRQSAAAAAKLPEVLHWVYNNKPSQFRRIEAQVQRLIPRLGKLHTPTVQNITTLALIDPRDEDVVYSLTQMSAGTRAIVALVTKVMLAIPGTWICLEEPEMGLHPQAQARLVHFLREESATKRIFGTTHAPSIVSVVPMASLFLVRREADNSTAAIRVTSENAAMMVDELGVPSTFSFESDAVVFVEQADNIPIYEAWARKHGFRIRVQFLACAAADTLDYYANARIALSKFVTTLVFGVFGNGSSQARKNIIQNLDLPEEQVVTLDFPELEGCLCDPKAIRKAFPGISLSESELEARLDPARILLDHKKALRELLSEYKIGEYDGQLGGRIAEAMDAIPIDVAQLFRRIEARSKPFWGI